MGARIAAAQPPYTEAVQGWLERVMPPGAAPLALFTTMARDERLFQRFFAGALLDRGNLTIRQREIVIDRTTARCGSEYEWGVHVAFFAQRAGFTPEHLQSLVHGSAGDACWSDAEKLLIDLCDELHETATVSEALWKALRAHYSEEAMLELVMLAGLYRMVSYLTNAVALPLESYSARFPMAPQALPAG